MHKMLNSMMPLDILCAWNCQAPIQANAARMQCGSCPSSPMTAAATFCPSAPTEIRLSSTSVTECCTYSRDNQIFGAIPDKTVRQSKNNLYKILPE